MEPAQEGVMGQSIDEVVAQLAELPMVRTWVVEQHDHKCTDIASTKGNVCESVKWRIGVERSIKDGGSITP